ncbi:MAG: GFA family protein [Lysobacterales bacterium]
MGESTENWFSGGCHCGNVRFRVRIDEFTALECNCSVCSKKGFINLIAPAENFALLRGEEHLSSYRFNTGTAEHRFCTTCGIHPFSRPRSHPGSFDVNARCLDDGFSFLTLTPFDGQNWEENVQTIT